MGVNLILCTGKYATTPYYMPSADINFWAIEQLCFYVAENPYLVEESIVNLKLIEWISTECGLVDLAKELRKYVHKKNGLEPFVRLIFEYTHYMTSEEVAELIGVLSNPNELDVINKEKLRADYFLSKKRKQKAVHIYKAILPQIGDRSVEFKASVVHNLGIAYAMLFEFENAATCFLDAFTLTNNKVHQEAYLHVKRLQLSEREYVDFIAGHQNHYETSLACEAERKNVIAAYQIGSDKEKNGLSANRHMLTREAYGKKVREQLEIVQDNYKKSEGLVR